MGPQLPLTQRRSLGYVKLNAKSITSKQTQYSKTMEWKAENHLSVRSAAAWAKEQGYKQVTRSCLQERLQKIVENEAAHGNGIYTVDEEKELVQWLKIKNRIGEAACGEELGERMVEVLDLRKLTNRHAGRRSLKLSRNARTLCEAAVTRRRPSRQVISRFVAKHHLQIGFRRQQSLELQRNLWVRKNLSLKHFRELDQTLRGAGITQPDGETDGTRVITSDECPNPIGAASAKGYGKLKIGGKGEPCNYADIQPCNYATIKSRYFRGSDADSSAQAGCGMPTLSLS